MSKAEIKYILGNVANLQEYDKLNLLRQMKLRNCKISEGSDGSRIWLDRIPLTELKLISSYIATIMERDKEHFL